MASRIVVVWLGVECLAAMASWLVPASRYLDLYLSAEAEEAATSFLAGEGILLPDSQAGWRSAPDQALDKWVIDHDGARVTGRGGWNLPGSIDVLALGSSMMNGGTAVTNGETITAYLEDGHVVTHNYGTMLYGLDQVLLTYRSRLAHVRADVVLVGLDPNPYAPLGNVYVPLRSPDEVNMPFVKPRFVLQKGEARLVPADPYALLPANRRARLVEHLRAHDAYAWRFEWYRHTALTPLAAAANYVQSRARSLFARSGDSSDQRLLLGQLMRQMADEAEARGARLCFVAMPSPPGGRLPWEPDLYAQRLGAWRGAGHCVVDGRAALERAVANPAALFAADRAHLNANGNKALAAEIARTLADLADP